MEWNAQTDGRRNVRYSGGEGTVTSIDTVRRRLPIIDRFKLKRSACGPPGPVSYLMEDPLVGLVAKASALRAAESGFHSRLRRGDFFPGRVIPVT